MKRLLLFILLSATAFGQSALYYQTVTELPAAGTTGKTVLRTTDSTLWQEGGGPNWVFVRKIQYYAQAGGGSPPDTTFLATRTWVQSLPNTYTLVAKLANDAATGANTTPISLTGLVFTYEANSTYRINFYGRISSAANTTGCGFQFDLSSAVTTVTLEFFHQLANTGTLTGGSSIADDASAGVSSGVPANGGIYPVMGHGILITGANTGTAQLRYRSETTAVTTAKAGLTIVVEKIQ